MPEQNNDFQRLYMYIKGIEGKLNNLTREVDILKNNTSSKLKEVKDLVNDLNGEYIDVVHTQSKLNKQLDLIVKELEKTATTEQINVVKKYIEYWNPINFVTKKELDKVIEHGKQQ